MTKLKKMDYSGDGTIYEVVEGKRYKLVLSMGVKVIDPESGKARYPRRAEYFDGTYKQAVKRMEAMHAERDLLANVADVGLNRDELSKYGMTDDVVFALCKSVDDVRREYERRRLEATQGVTFAEWCEQYLSTRERQGERRENTYKADRAYSKHLVNALGDYRLVDIKPSTIKAMYADMKERNIGATTMNQAHKLLKRIMHAALVDELINRNPCDVVDAPKKPKAKRRALTADQAARIRDLTSTGNPTSNEVAVFLGLSLGARVGEVLGLEWRHAQLSGEQRCVHICQQLLSNGETGPLKTDDDDNPIGRVVPIDSATVELLKRWKAAQRDKLNGLGIEQGNTTPIITNEVGGYSERHNFSSWFRSWCVDNGYGQWATDDGKRIVELTYGLDDPALYDDCLIEWKDVDGWPCDASGKRFSRSYKRPPKVKRHYDGLVFHELRHTHFTMRLASGTSIPVAQALGGWSTPAMLMETYLHATPEGIWSEAGFMDDVLSSGKL